MPATADESTAILQALVSCPSVTPSEAGAQAYLAKLLADGGFAVDRMVFSEAGTADVDNLFATIGAGSPHLVFAGHTDVVPAGNVSGWSHPPFAAEIADGVLYGRGAVDMKGGIACFMASALGFLRERPAFGGSLSVAITGDEEGPSINGTAKLVDWAQAAGHRLDAALVGEPTGSVAVGDTIKIGRRGSLSGTVRVFGRQGHVAYPHLADNPMPRLIAMMSRLNEAHLDEASPEFEASNLEITGINVDNPTHNVIPAEAEARFNVRFNDQWTIDTLTAFIERELAAGANGGDFELTIHPGASNAFLTRSESLIVPLRDAVAAVTGLTPALTTGGGTSDARFFAPLCPVVELGLVGRTMHQVDERVPLADLETLTAIYRSFLARFFAEAGTRYA